MQVPELCDKDKLKGRQYSVCNPLSGIWAFPMCFLSELDSIHQYQCVLAIHNLIDNEELIACTRLESNRQEYPRVSF